MKYDAFISYRHGGVDQFVAETLHKKLEAFKLPKRLHEKSNGKERITRVFRDQDELPLSSNLEDSIKEALSESEWLIVICTPRLKESIWCMKEIETFGEMHGKDHILAVLVEGEPNESFPEQLRTAEVTKFDAVSGRNITFTERVEPLAADVRAPSNSKIKKALETEILRLLAPMFGVDFDDLKMRQRARRIRRIAILTSIVVALSMGFAIFTAIMNIRINKQKNEIEQQNIQIEAQNEDIIKKNEKIEDQMKDLLYNQAKSNANESLRYNDNNMKNQAIKIAYDSLTDRSEYPLPQTSYCELALSEALDVYHYDRSFRAVDIIDINKQIYTFDSTKTMDYLLFICTDNTVVIYDYSARKTIWETELSSTFSIYNIINKARFVSEDEFAIVDSNNARYYKITDGKVEEEAVVDLGFGATELTNTLHMKHTIYSGDGASCIVDNETKEIIYKNNKTTDISISSNGKFIAALSGSKIKIFSAKDTKKELAVIDEGELWEDIAINGLNVLGDPDMDNRAFLTFSYSPIAENRYTTYAYKINTDDGSVMWKQKLDGFDMTSIRFNTNDYKGLIIYNANHTYLIDVKTGELMMQYDDNSSSGRVRDVLILENSFMMILEDGRIINYFAEIGMLETLDHVDVRAAKIEKTMHCTNDYGIIFPAVTTGNTTIVVFAYNNPTRLNYVDSYKKIETITDTYVNNEARDKGQELGIEDGNLVESLVCLEEEDLVFAIFNSYLRVYQLSTKEVLYETTYIDHDYFFFGGEYNVDDDGNIYIRVNDGALVFNADVELIAVAKGVVGFEYGTNNMVFSSLYSGSGYHVGGLVPLDELLYIAELKMK